MTKHPAVSLAKAFAVAGFFALGFSLSAEQPTDGAQTFSALNNAPLRFSSLTLAENSSFTFAGAVAPDLSFSWMDAGLPPADVVLPPLLVTQPKRVATVSAALAEDSSKDVLKVRRPTFDYARGEIGAIYGRSTGKFGGDFEAGYILGEVGNEHLQISAGASYEHSSGRVPRWAR